MCPSRPAGRLRLPSTAAAHGLPLRPQRHEHGRLDARRGGHARLGCRRSCEPLAAVQVAKLTVLSGLTLNGGRALGDGGGDHARCVASFLTGVHPLQDRRQGHPQRRLGRPGRRRQVGHRTRFASLELGCEPRRPGRAIATPATVASTPRTSRGARPPRPWPRRPTPRRSSTGSSAAGRREEIAPPAPARLDIARASSTSCPRTPTRCSGKLGRADRRKLDEYLYAVREIERRIADSRSWPAPSRTPPTSRARRASPRLRRPRPADDAT